MLQGLSLYNFLKMQSYTVRSFGEDVVFLRMHRKSVTGTSHGEYLDDIMDWCDMEFHQLVETAQTHST